MKDVLIATFLIIGLVVGIFLLQTLGFESFKFWAPKYEDAHRQVFENTKSFRDGSARDLDNLRVAYSQAKTPEEKSIILDTIRHRALSVPSDQLSPAVNQLINQGQ